VAKKVSPLSRRRRRGGIHREGGRGGGGGEVINKSAIKFNFKFH
jgi:hypothetical protein